MKLTKRTIEIIEPPAELLQKYAELLVNFALGGGVGIKPDEVVWVEGSEACRPLFLAVIRQVWKSGGHVISDYATDIFQPSDNIMKEFYQNASQQQLEHFNRKYFKGLADQVDHRLAILCDTDLRALAEVDPAKLMRRGEVSKPFYDWLDVKENAGKFTWTLALYGTEQMAKEAGLSLAEYWQQIEEACYLDHAEPIKQWQKLYKEIDRISQTLNDMEIESVHVVGADVDLKLTIGKERKWCGGRGRNIPSYEIFTSPDWRGTEGWIRINQPLYRYGNIVEGIELWFEKGRVVKSKAAKNQKVLREMIATKNADRLGEFSMTDADHSRITKFMAETLFDENMGGRFGNSHVALGMAYKDCFKGDPTKLKKADWEKLGYNDSSVHTDVVTTTDRTVTASLPDGSQKVIYRGGHFTV
ncbi:MAG: aminopeptidase [Candidatus Nomurabacteria bacterium]|jgi:aminopeptidase|nr:aminopeptidase [Candidatus Nomurabacteria bacterium]